MSRCFSALVLVLCLLISGCAGNGDPAGAAGGGNAEGSKADSGKADSGQAGNTGAGGETGSGESGGPAASGGAVDAAITGNRLYVKERQSVRFNEPEEGYQTINRFYDVFDGKIYLLRVEALVSETDGGENLRLCVQTFDSSTRAIEQYILTPEIPGDGEYAVFSAGLTDGGDISLKLAELNGEGESYSLARLDLQGNLLETADSFPDEEEYPWNLGYLSGKKAHHLSDGRTVISRWDMDTFTTTLTWYDGKTGQTFAQIKEGTLEGICSDGNGVLYCLTRGSLVRLDAEGNIEAELFRLNENGIEYGEEFALFCTDEGILLCNINREEVRLYTLTDQRIVNDEEIRMAFLGGTSGMQYIQRLAAKFPYETGSLPISMETAESEAYQEDYRTRIMAEMTAGEGPDILLLSRSDMTLLAEKGYLCDLSGMIEEDVKAWMIPSVLELGTVDGKLAAITPQVEFSTMITGDRTWEKDSWNIAEFKELAESRDDWELLLSYRDVNIGFYTLYYWMFGDGILNSPLLDLEQGVSHLDSEEFVEILELCRKYSDRKVSLDGSEADALLREGKIAARRIAVYNLVDFSADMSRYSEGCHFVGAPSESGNVSCVESYSFQYLAVNANSPHKEVIGEFIAYLLDYENQHAVEGCSVRLDVIRDSVTEDSYMGYVMRCSADPENPEYILLQNVKPDGTPWLEEFLDFVKNSAPPPAVPEEITKIIGSEIYSYYEEGRSARDAADNIHNRVQLYLDERK